jgi:hypothetical protein
MDQLIDAAENVLVKEAESLLEANQPVFAAQVIERGLEACERCARLVQEAKTRFNSLSVLHRRSDWPLPPTRWSSQEDRLAQLRDRLLIALARSMPGLSPLSVESGQWSDYFGQGYIRLLQECYSLVAEDRVDLLEKLFSPLFYSSLAAERRVATRIGDRDDRIAGLYRTESLEDLLDLSGFALVLAELDGSSSWSCMERVWKSYFNNLPTDEARSTTAIYLASIVVFRSSIPGFASRDSIRWNWRHKLEERLRARGILDGEMFVSRKAVKAEAQSNLLLRVLSGGWNLLYSPAEMFTVLYLRRIPGNEALPLTHMAKSLLDHLDRESSTEADSQEERVDERC